MIAHRTHIIRRCAPEQVRFATTEEKALLSDPQNQLLGMKDLMDSGTFRSSQFHDLISQAYPPQEEHAMNPQGVEAQVESFGRAIAESADVPAPRSEASPPVQPVFDTPAPAKTSPQSKEETIDKSPMDDVPMQVSRLVYQTWRQVCRLQMKCQRVTPPPLVITMDQSVELGSQLKLDHFPCSGPCSGQHQLSTMTLSKS